MNWQKVHGRNDLPWQNTQDPYRVWLSEIMLQQTQVVTVKAYFCRFVERFPNVVALAAATLDEVLGFWSGLGYYTRARNLHRCAQIVATDFNGKFPNSAQELRSLPGIGRSTAAAIASLCFGEPVAILDANVKRVVARVKGFGLDVGKVANERQLWDLATVLLPASEEVALSETMARYTQGMMDLGATICQPKAPLCSACPVSLLCQASKEGSPEKYPVRTRVVKRTTESIWLLWIQREDGAVWLSQRPTPGVWAGLYCMPWSGSEAELEAFIPIERRPVIQEIAPVVHALTHKDLFLHPRLLHLPGADASLFDLGFAGRWFEPKTWPELALPAPIRKLLQQGPLSF